MLLLPQLPSVRMQGAPMYSVPPAPTHSLDLTLTAVPLIFSFAFWGFSYLWSTMVQKYEIENS